MNKKDLKGHCPSKGSQVKFQITQTERGAQATSVEVLAPPEEQTFFGEIKSFNPSKGFTLSFWMPDKAGSGACFWIWPP